MDQRLTIITLGVKNLKVSTAFYEEVFGWQKMPSSNADISFFHLNGILLSLYPREQLAEDAGVAADGQGFKGFTLAFNARSKNEVDQIIQDLKSKNVKIIKPPQDVFWGGYSSYVADPDGNLWEIAHNPYLSLDEAGNVINP